MQVEQGNAESPAPSRYPAHILISHASIDVSDGLMADLGHILTRSQVGAELWFDALPTHPWLAAQGESLARELVAGGDDYELCFTAGVEVRSQISALASVCPVSRVGRVVAGTGARLLASSGTDILIGSNGFDHFQS